MSWLSSIIPSIFAAAEDAPPPGSIFGMPPQASTIAPTIDLVYDIITWISIFFFVLIVVVMVVFVIKYRRTTHVANTSGPTHNTPLEVTWSVIPLILVIAMFYVGFKGYVYIRTPPENAYEIQGRGQRWFWTFNYPNGASETNILHVPAGRPVRIRLTSDDVIHALFIPAFRVKQDVVPGKRTDLWFEATHPGNYDLFCAEYCGTSHSQMVGRVMVYEPDEFETVIEEAARWIDKVPDDKLYLAGAHFFNQCASCHTLDGSPLIGPSFKETHELYATKGKRKLADGSEVTVDREYLHDSIMAPQGQTAVDSATGAPYPASMPPGIGRQLGDRRVEAMIQFIMNLDKVAPDGKLEMVPRRDLIPKKETQETPEGQ